MSGLLKGGLCTREGWAGEELVSGLYLDRRQIF